MKKNLLKLSSLLLAIVMVLSVAPLAELSDSFLSLNAHASDELNYGQFNENMMWKYDVSTNTVTVSASEKADGDSSYTSPDMSSVEHLVFEEGITSIPKGFGSQTLKSVKFPKSIQQIEQKAFQRCFALETVIFEELNHDNGLVIYTCAFADCPSLRSITLPEGLKIIGVLAFGGCISLAEITIPSTVESIYDEAFMYCTKLETLSVKNDNNSSKLETIGIQAFRCCFSLKSISLPESLKKVEAQAFKYCQSLESLKIPENTYFYPDSFENCIALKNIEYNGDKFKFDENNILCDSLRANIVPYQGITDYKVAADAEKVYLDRSTNIEKFEVEEGNEVFFVGETDGALYKNTNTGVELVKVPCKTTEYTVPSYVTQINSHAFWGADLLREINVENEGMFKSENGVLYSQDSNNSGGYILEQYPVGKDCVDVFEIPEEVTSIKELAFAYTNIKAFAVEEGNSKYVTDNYGALYIKDGHSKLSLYLYPCASEQTEYTLSVSKFNIHAFYGSNIEAVNIKDKYFDLIVGMGIVSSGIPKINYIGNWEDFWGREYFEFISDADIVINAEFPTDTPDEPNIPDEGEEYTLTGNDSIYNVTFSYESSCFGYDENGKPEAVSFSVEKYASYDSNEIPDSFRIYNENAKITYCYAVKFYKDGVEVQPKSGHKVKIGFPVSSTDRSSDMFVIHERSDDGVVEFFVKGDSNRPVKVENDYLYIETENFSPFMVVVGYHGEMKITSTPKTSYIYKEALDISGLELAVVYEDGTTATVTDTSKMQVTGYDSKKIGTQTLTVEYEGLIATYEVNVQYAWWQILIRILLLGFLWY